MKILKMSLVLILSLAMVTGMAFADISDEPIVKWLQAKAEVLAPLEGGRLLVSIDGQEIALNIGDETIVIEAESGLPGQLNSLEKGDAIYVYYSPAMTKSLPPQSFAGAIVVGVSENKTIPSWFTVKKIISVDETHMRVINEEGDLIVTLLKESPITPFKTKQMVTIDDVRVGTQLFVWYDIVLTSYPGQTASYKTVIVGQNEAIKPIALNLSQTEQYKRGQEVMVPIRKVLESLDMAVVWDQSIRGVQVHGALGHFEIRLGENPFSGSELPELKDQKMYVPLSLLSELLGREVVIENMQ